MAPLPVEVAILDTAPSLKQLEHGYDQFVTNGSPRNDLLANLLGPTGFQLPNPALRITYDSTTRYGAPFMQATVQGRDRLYIEDHDYLMNDHGSFIAGIIFELTHSGGASYESGRDVSLHLIQVLNDYGIGSLETIARGLLTAWNSKAKDAALVINCSFMLPVPRHKSHSSPKGDETFTRAWKRLQDNGKNDYKNTLAYIERWTWVLDYLCSLLRTQGVTIVAAAGNDGSGASGALPPKARFPAAFRSVVGVSALAERGQQTPANYSNEADNPLRDGFATFGGLRDNNGFTDTVQGVPGVYIGIFPAPPASLPPPNTTGYAMWSGTSFAAPIISAALAIGRSSGTGPDQVVDDLHNAAPAVAGASVIPIA
jgi:subtilisin family serine protease